MQYLTRILRPKHNLATKEIAPQLLRLADGKMAGEIMSVANTKFKFNGQHETSLGYVMHYLANPLILGKPGMNKYDVVYCA